jgi:hypothetical protein
MRARDTKISYPARRAPKFKVVLEENNSNSKTAPTGAFFSNHLFLYLINFWGNYIFPP